MEAEAAARQATDSTLPQKEAALREAQQAVGERQRVVSQLDQSRQVDENSLGHTNASSNSWTRASAGSPGAGAASAYRYGGSGAKTGRGRGTGANAGHRASRVEGSRDRRCPNSTPPAPAHARTRAARKALHQNRSRARRAEKTAGEPEGRRKARRWLRSRGLDAAPRLWEKLRVAPGWEAAVEAVLRERLQAVAADAQPGWFADAPPARLTVWTGEARRRRPRRKASPARSRATMGRSMRRSPTGSPVSTGPTTPTRPRAPAAPASSP